MKILTISSTAKLSAVTTIIDGTPKISLKISSLVSYCRSFSVKSQISTVVPSTFHKVFPSDSPTGRSQHERDTAIAVTTEPVRLFASIDVGNERVVSVADEMGHGPSYTGCVIRHHSKIGADSFTATFRWQDGGNFVFMGTSCLHVRSRTRS